MKPHSEQNHSVENHLQVNVEEYDKMIRVFVPHYEELLETAVGFLNELMISPSASVLDLGGGTGALTQAIAVGCPKTRIELIDIDPKMLTQARIRLAAHVDRVNIREGSFHDPLPPTDVVVASLSLHHIHDLEQKTKLYRSI